MNGTVANKNHRESHDYDYDPLEVIIVTSLMYLCLQLCFKPWLKRCMEVFDSYIDRHQFLPLLYHWPNLYY